MIRMKINRVDRQNNNTPILSNSEIESFAYDVMKDYKPELLREPGAVSYEHFLENYLELEVVFKDIYYDDPKRPIFGLTAFRGCTVKVFDRENECISNMIVPPNTVIIDNYVLESGREGMAAFTGFHEGGHYLIHPEVYTVQRTGLICCRRENLESVKEDCSQWTAAQWREHHANHFASSFAMPNTTFRPLVNAFLRENSVWKGRIILGADDDLDLLAKDILPEYIVDIYGVSKRAAAVKLRKSGFVV